MLQELASSPLRDFEGLRAFEDASPIDIAPRIVSRKVQGARFKKAIEGSEI